MGKLILVDSHCHLDMLEGFDVSHYLEEAKALDVGYFLNVSVALTDLPKVLKAAETFSNVYASVGQHPNEREEEEATVEYLIKAAAHPKVVAIGETGLDYFRSTGDLTWQQNRFRKHITAAKSTKKPLIIHTRAAKADTITILSEEKADHVGGVMHCFTEDWTTAKAALDLGFYISFSGIVTFKTATELQEVAKKVPFDRMLIETDSPYLAPNPKRGKQNQPAYVRYTAEYIAALRGVSLETLAEKTTANFFNLFKGADYV